MAPEVSAKRGSVSSPRLCKQQQTCVSSGQLGQGGKYYPRKNSVLAGFAPGKLPDCLQSHPVCSVPWLFCLLGNQPREPMFLPSHGESLTAFPLGLSHSQGPRRPLASEHRCPLRGEQVTALKASWGSRKSGVPETLGTSIGVPGGSPVPSGDSVLGFLIPSHSPLCHGTGLPPSPLYFHSHA